MDRKTNKLCLTVQTETKVKFSSNQGSMELVELTGISKWNAVVSQLWFQRIYVTETALVIAIASVTHASNGVSVPSQKTDE